MPRIESTVSPKNSMPTGLSISGDQTSTMPPRSGKFADVPYRVLANVSGGDKTSTRSSGEKSSSRRIIAPVFRSSSGERVRQINDFGGHDKIRRVR